MSVSRSTDEPHVLAIDVGTSSSRTGVFDRDLNLIADTFSQQHYEMHTGADGRATLEPVELARTVMRCVTRSLEAHDKIDAVASSCFWHSILGLDRDGKPTTDVLMWADTRASSAVESLADLLDPDRHHQLTGTRLHASYPSAKLAWLRENDPDTFRRTSFWVSFPEFLQTQITGHHSISTSMASGTGLFNRQTADWDYHLLSLIGIDPVTLGLVDDRPIPVSSLASIGSSRDVLWFPAIGDGAANNLGSQAVDAHHPALMIGTTGALRVLTERPPDVLPAKLWQYRLDTHTSMLGGALSEGGGVVAWLMENLRAGDYDDVEAAIRSATPDAHGLTILPYLAGERSPGWHSDAVGTIHGLRFDTSPADILQATMESVGYSFAALLDSMDGLLQKPVELIATGNALRRNEAWTQILADILQTPLLVPKQTESSLRGAALHALLQMGHEPEQPDLHSSSTRYEPRSGYERAHREARNRRDKLYTQLVSGRDARA